MTKYFTYILANQKNGTLYIGSTNDLVRRVYQHKEKSIKGFTSKYNVDQLVYFEEFDSPDFAVARERQIKKWNRAWKLELIEKDNPDWDDLFDKIHL